MTFAGLFVPAELERAVGDEAWVGAMLDAERALAAAEAQAGVVPHAAAESIAAACRSGRFDAVALAAAARATGNPAEPLVRALREQVGGEAATYVHWGATSQDVVDTAAMLVSRRALALIGADLDAVAALVAGLARTYRDTPMAARTLLQQAVPTTFGCKGAGWLVAVLHARRRLAAVADGLPAQLGGAAGTLAPLGDAALEVLGLYAAELDLAEPPVPWQANRLVVAELGATLSLAAGALAKIALDVILLAQTEVGEVAEAGAGGSSTMPQKRNPTAAVLAGACARGVRGHAGVLAEAVVVEHERAAGAWQSEWSALSGALALTGGAAAAVRRSLDGLQVDAERMRHNLDATGGAILSERVVFHLARRDGREAALETLDGARRRADERGTDLRRALAADLSAEELDELFDPLGYLGAAGAFVDRALALFAGGA